MRSMVSLFALALLLALPVAADPAGETLYLQSGAVVSGEILKEGADAVAVDLGYDVLSIPLDRIVRREKGGLDEAEGEAAESDFYVVRSHPVRSVKDNVKRFGSGVVLVRTLNGLGSGFIVNGEGYVVTNFHVIAGEQEISVFLFQRRGAGFERIKLDGARIVSVNPFLDLALLKVDPPPGVALTVLALGDIEEVRSGEPVFALGNPLGLERSVSEGIISTDKRNFGGILYLQTTAAVNPGNSGGPLFNLRGQVVGVINMKAGWMTEGLSFAIPVDDLKGFLRNRDAFAFDPSNPNSGYHYIRPPAKPDRAEDRPATGPEREEGGTEP